MKNVIVVAMICLLLVAGSTVYASMHGKAVVSPDQTITVPVIASVVAPDQAKPDQVKPDQAKPDQVKCSGGVCSLGACNNPQTAKACSGNACSNNTYSRSVCSVAACKSNGDKAIRLGGRTVKGVAATGRVVRGAIKGTAKGLARLFRRG